MLLFFRGSDVTIWTKRQLGPSAAADLGSLLCSRSNKDDCLCPTGCDVPAIYCMCPTADISHFQKIVLTITALTSTRKVIIKKKRQNKCVFF